jgi:hypothetical protein
VADGHLSFEHEDMAARQFNEMVRFARVYDNHNKDPSPLGVGWTHNWDGFIVEERPGRYAVVKGGQARPFPRCTLNEDHSYACTTDNGHGGKLHVANPTARLPSFTYTNEVGAVHRFDRGSLESQGRGRRKWLLTAYSADADHPFRAKPITRSGPSRSPVPGQADHRRSEAALAMWVHRVIVRKGQEPRGRSVGRRPAFPWSGRGGPGPRRRRQRIGRAGVGRAGLTGGRGAVCPSPPALPR